MIIAIPEFADIPGNHLEIVVGNIQVHNKTEVKQTKKCKRISTCRSYVFRGSYIPRRE